MYILLYNEIESGGFMVDLNAILKKIEGQNQLKFTTKELLEQGFNHYYIKKALENHILVRISKGKYVMQQRADCKRRTAFKKFSTYVLDNDFDNAYYALVQNIENQVDHTYDNHLQLYGLLLKKLLEEKNYDFSILENLWVYSETNFSSGYYNYFRQFSEAVMSGEYEEAFVAMHYFKKFEHQKHKKNWISTTLFHHLISCIVYSKKKSQNSTQKQRPEEISYLHQQNLMILQQQGAFDRHDECQPIFESKESEKTLDLDTLFYQNYRLFHQSFIKENYEEAKQHLEASMVYTKNEISIKFLNQILQLLDVCIELKTNKIILKEKKQVYKTVYEALENRDYICANRMIQDCILKEPNRLVWKQYSLLLGKIVATQNQEDTKRKERLKVLSMRIKKYAYQMIMPEDIARLEKLLQEKINWNYVEKVENKYDYYALDLIDMIQIVQDQQLQVSDFATFDYTEETSQEKFFRAIEQGDYLTAHDVMQNTDCLTQATSMKEKHYMRLYRNLLSYLTGVLKRNATIEGKSQNLKLDVNVDTTYLYDIQKQVEQGNYDEALVTITGRETTQHFKPVLKTAIQFLKNNQKKNTAHYFEQYQQGMKIGDTDVAYKNLVKYQDQIKKLGPSQELDYHFARIKALKREIHSEKFALKERLYDSGSYWLEQQDYKKCIEDMNQYIAFDCDTSAKGYFLRGTAYQQIKEYNRAISDYKKAIAIIKEPMIFHQLGLLYCTQQEYEKALQCFLSCEVRAPYQNIENLMYISQMYQVLGNQEKQKQYEMRANYIKSEVGHGVL